jgi:hypothetical protein
VRNPTLRLTLTYFGIVFGAGFLLGTIRTIWLEPLLGQRSAELFETPFMVAVYTATAFYLVDRWRAALTLRSAALIGLGALIILLVFEFSVVLTLRGLTVSEYLSSRDPVAGTVYVMSLIVFAAMPAVALLRKNNTQNGS